MKNTTFRKKALLSSVAMLLVALVALGSATFAWFAANPNADATGLSLKTTASTGLVIKTETDNDVWRHDSILRAATKSTVDTLGTTNATAFNLTPVSMKQDGTGSFYTVDADLASNYATSKTPVSATSGYYEEKIYCRLSDGSSESDAAGKKVYLTGVTLTKNESATMQNAIRVAITGPSGLIGTYAIATTGAHGVLTPADGEFNPALTAIGTGKTDLKVNTGLSDLSTNASDLTKYITVYVYLDGQDGDCYSDKVGSVNATQIISSLKIDLTLDD